MILEVHDVWTVVQHCTDDELLTANVILRAKKPFNRHLSGSMWAGAQQAYVNFLDAQRRRFPTGLLGLLQGRWQGPLELRDHRRQDVVPARGNWLPLLVEKRAQQIEVIKTMIRAKRGVVQAATGFGKTEVMKALIGYYGLRVLVLVPPDKQLCLQTVQRLRAVWGAEVGQFGAGKHEVRRVTVALSSSLIAGRRFRTPEAASLVRDADVLLVDECHHTAAPGIYWICMNCRAPFRFGLSATITVAKDAVGSMRIFAALGGLLSVIEIADTAGAGHIARPYAITLSWEQHRQADPVVDYQDLYTRLIVQNRLRNATIVRAALTLIRQKRPLLLTVRDTKNRHGHVLQSMLAEQGVCMPVLTGVATLAEREREKERLEKGEIPGLIATSIFDEGKDVPDIAGVVLGGGGKAPRALLQRLGRGCRRKEHNFVVLVDLEDHFHRKFREHARARAKTLARAGILVFQGWDNLECPGPCEAAAAEHYSPQRMA